MRPGIGAETYGDTFAYRPGILNIFLLHVGFQAAIHLFGDLTKGKFAKGNQISPAEKILERLVYFLRVVNLAALHAVLQRFGSQVDHHDFVGVFEHPIGNCFSNFNSGNGRHRRSNTFEVLHIHCGKNFHSCFDQVQDVFVSFAIFAAGNVCMREFVDQDDARISGLDRVGVHLLEYGALIFDFPTGNLLQLGGKLRDAFSSVCFNKADNDVFAAAASPDCFAQHAVSFAHTWSVSKKQLHNSLGAFLGGTFFQPLLGRLRHRRYSRSLCPINARLHSPGEKKSAYDPRPVCGRAGSGGGHHKFLSPHAPVQRHDRGVHLSARYPWSFNAVGARGFRVHVTGRHAGLQLLFSAPGRHIYRRRSAELGGAGHVPGDVSARQRSFHARAQPGG